MKTDNTKKKAKKIGQKWAVISTIFGFVVAFLIWSVMAGLSSASQLLIEPNLIIGLISAFAFSVFIGRVTGTNFIKGKKYVIGKWIFNGFLTSYSSLIIPLMIETISIVQFFQGIGFYIFMFTIYGAIPILILGFLFGSFLKNELYQLKFKMNN